MKKPLMCVVGGGEVAIVCALALATACTGAIGTVQGNSGQAGGSPAGVGGTGTPGTGSSTGAGGSATGSAGTGATGTGATGGAAGMADVGTIYPNPPAYAPAPGLLRRLTRNQFRNAVRDVFGYDVNVGDLDADSFTANFASIGAATVVTSDRGVEQYSTAIENAVNAVFADSTKRSQFIGCTPTGQTQRYLRARLHPEARAPRVATAAREHGARSIRRARRQRVDDPGQRDRGGALGDGGAVHVAELSLSPGDRSRLHKRRASTQRLRDRLAPLVPDLEQPSGPDADRIRRRAGCWGPPTGSGPPRRGC